MTVDLWKLAEDKLKEQNQKKQAENESDVSG